MNSITVFSDSGQVRPGRTKTKIIVNVYLTNFKRTKNSEVSCRIKYY